jgi:hypothetical protein
MQADVVSSRQTGSIDYRRLKDLAQKLA